MKKIITLVIFLFSLTAYAQITFQKLYHVGVGQNWGYSAHPTSDGGYILVGNASSSNVVLIKTDGNGDTLWTKTYDAGSTYGWDVQYTSFDGGYIIGGSDMIIKIGGNGTVLWSKYIASIGGCFSIQQTTDLGYVFTGQGNSGRLTKLDLNGDFVWSNFYFGAGPDLGSATQYARQTNDGGFILSGRTNHFGAGSSDIYLIKTDADGNYVWSKTYGGTGYETSNCVQQTSDGGYIISGYTNSFGAGGYDVYLIKTDGSGTLSWSKTYGGTSNDNAYTVRQTSDLGYIICGPSQSYVNGVEFSIYLIKTNSSGNVTWSRSYGQGTDQFAATAQQTNDGGYIIASDMNPNIYLIKTDMNGYSGCNDTAAITLENDPPTVETSPDDSSLAITNSVIVASLTTAGGATITTLCTSVPTFTSEVIQNENTFSLFPNPATNQLTIENEQVKISSIAIYDMLGERIIFQLSESGNQHHIDMNVSKLTGGIYFVKVTGEKEEDWVMKFVKE